jgi:hypothetical protein
MSEQAVKEESVCGALFNMLNLNTICHMALRGYMSK